MRVIPFLLFLFFGSAYALDDCPGGRWTSEEPISSHCDGLACFERHILSQDGVVCGRTLDTAYLGYFTVRIYDAENKLHVTEKYLLDPNENNIYRVEVFDSNGHLIFFEDEKGNSFYPNGNPIPESIPNPGGRFYEEVLNPFQSTEP